MSLNFSSYFKKPLGWLDLLVLISALFLIVMFSITLITSYLFPIYPDEIAVRVWLSRTIYDFPEKISVYPTCEGFVQMLPATWTLPGMIEWAVHGNVVDVRTLRLLGIIGELVLMAILVYQLTISDYRNDTVGGAKGSMSWESVLYSAGFVISILSIGVLPVFLVTNRQEQIILPLTALMLTSFFKIDNNPEELIPKKKILFEVLTYLISISLILYSHPKGIFLSPFLMLVGFQIFRRYKNRGLTIFGTLVVMSLLIQSYFAWKSTFLCAKTPMLNLLLKSFYIDPAVAVHNPRLFFDELLGSLWNFDKYITQLTFQQFTDSSYLPAIQIGKLATLANFVIKVNTLIMFVGALIFLPFFYIKDILKGHLISMNFILIVFLVCVLVGASLSLTKNWYDAGYLYVMLAIICLFIFAENKYKFNKPMIKATLIYFSCATIFSQAVFNYRYLPAFLGGFAGPGISIKTYNYQQAKRDVLTSAKACAIDPVTSKGIIFDDYTYLFFRKSQKPMAITYILYLRGQAFADFIVKSGSAGMVTRCTSIPQPYLPYAKVTGSVCCVPQDALKEVAKDGLPGI